MGFTKAQERALGKGYAAVLERANTPHLLTVQLSWNGQVQEPQMLDIIRRTLDANIESQVSMSRIHTPTSQLDDLRQALLRSETHVDMLRARINALEEQQQEEAVSLRDWAEMRGFSYSTAWRHMKAGHIKSIVVGGGRKNANVLVYPSTFAQPASKRRKTK